ncbi:hypothetical protein Fleli_1692 [Bernardetia litoralis DSM 6794]|uniref:DUF4097 domain-containing protein n=1 Tax=Bernardetia litoralis (strain ATCC 23117 / DSM 6794 / NBRC 15988 / NCIMB 1366 / Fx l1 / Sio-4) TaxID=880071 RepID=I4AJG5_BERLS|nr:DUF4097 family beta strand repeat-containing protein [Bernardetia litoralis]AFM04100.1 hypothetical protein Fleli_1692 [Bernardetia litoralis DSM 6794]
MKNLHKSQFVILTFLLLCIGFLIPLSEANATKYQPKEEKQKVVKATFKVNSDELLTISNKYGNINFTNHDKNEVSIHVTILAWARSDKEAQKILDRIEIDQDHDSESITFETQIEESRGGYSSSNREGFEINYEVKIPKKINLDIENKFGSVTLADLQGKLNLELQHGNFNAHNLSGMRHSINITFGNFSVDEISSADIEVAHGSINIDKSTTDLKIESKHSNIRIDDANVLEIEAKHGNMRIGTVTKIRGDNAFGRIEIRKVLKYAVLELRHGNCQIEQIVKGFDKIEVENAHGSIELRFDSDAKFQFEASTTHGSIRNSISNTTIQREEDEDYEQILEGKTNGGGNGKVYVTNQHGSIRLEER